MVDYRTAVDQLRRQLLPDTFRASGVDVVVHAPRPLSLQIGNSGRAEHATETRALSTPPKADRYIG
jgi:hypothetical protein